MALMFQRLARNFAKNGYYPTDADTIERVLSMLEPSETGTLRILDPCAGEGVALAECKAFLGAERTEAFGVEFDRERAWHAKEILDRVIHGDFQETFVGYRSFGLLWLNPPYGDLVGDQAATGDARKGRARLEKVFYQRAVKLLQPGGVMVLIVPHYGLDKDLSGWIARDFESVAAFLAPEQRFKQAVVVGVRRPGWAAAGDEAKMIRSRLGEICCGEATEVLPEIWAGESYRVPAVSGGKTPFKFQAFRIDPEQLREEICRYPTLWPQFELHFGRAGQPHRRPLAGLSRWHLALSLAAGQVSGVVPSNDGSKVYVIKGDTFKEKEVTTSYEETSRGERREIRTATDVFVPVIRALDFTPGSPTFGQALVIK